MEWEVKPFGTAFDGEGIETGMTYDTGVPVEGIGSSVLLSEFVTGLTSETAYHWRMRIASYDPFFPHTPWFSPQGNGIEEVDLRTAAGVDAVSDVIPRRGGVRLAVHPNPVHSMATIRYTLPEPEDVSLGVYDVQGRLVGTLVDGPKDAGVHDLNWDLDAYQAFEVGNGVYWIRLTAGEKRTSKQVLVTR
jgi:hypothetical protein